ncbi:ABC transporter ATP-binding protein [Lachnospiraceae bacterium oral taxon 096]|jgi:ABC transporter related protein|nr:ABC transporter ATP-binding protein [Lachnospiraceae bacterium oral taxon 096]QUI95214.1 ABC transporter ATP-binding protein [Lachnospiraceae bacterium oral taxon 096]
MKQKEKTVISVGEPIIIVKNLYKFYQAGSEKVHALDGLDFEINKGEFCAIIGPSGSGKSTLLNMLAGLEKPSRGEIIINGKHIEKLNENQLVRFRRDHIGFIFQSYNLLQTMNAVENVAMPLMFRGVAKAKRTEIAKEYLRLVGLEKYMYHKGNAMSGGQQQRVGIARALAMQPDIIFADEPTGNLDTKTTAEVLELMQKIVKEKHQTLIMVTHDPEIAGFADRQIRIVDGKINNEFRLDIV